MSQLDLLTDADFQTTPKKAVRWKARWLFKEAGTPLCHVCLKPYPVNAGDERLSCCNSYATKEECDRESSIPISGDDWPIVYLGAIPVEVQ